MYVIHSIFRKILLVKHCVSLNNAKILAKISPQLRKNCNRKIAIVIVNCKNRKNRKIVIVNRKNRKNRKIEKS